MLYPELSCGCLISIISSQFKLHKSALIQFLKLYNHKSYVEVMQCKSVVGRMICCKFSPCTTGNGHKKRKEDSLQLTTCSWFCSKFAKKVFLVQFCLNKRGKHEVWQHETGHTKRKSVCSLLFLQTNQTKNKK